MLMMMAATTVYYLHPYFNLVFSNKMWNKDENINYIILIFPVMITHEGFSTSDELSFFYSMLNLELILHALNISSTDMSLDLLQVSSFTVYCPCSKA